jgi:hypothetical protein
MKNKLLSRIATVSVCACLVVACKSSSYASIKSGIDFELRGKTKDGAPLRPDGLFHVESLDRAHSAHVPVSPLEPDAAVQRLELPPGSYAVSYTPAELDFGIDGLRGRQPVTYLSQNPFVVVVSEGRFTPVSVRTEEAAPAKRPAPTPRLTAIRD